MGYLILNILAALMMLPAAAMGAYSSEQMDEQEQPSLLNDSVEKVSVVSWSPELIDSVYVNDTVSRTVKYSITTTGQTAGNYWAVDGIPVEGKAENHTYSYEHSWKTGREGIHTVTYKDNNSHPEIDFKWYVWVYQTGSHEGGSIFDIMDEALENHIINIKVRLFENQLSEKPNSGDFALQQIKRMQDAIRNDRKMLEGKRRDFISGRITIDEYVSALKQYQRSDRHNIKLIRKMAKTAIKVLNNETAIREMENISFMNADLSWSKS